MKKGRIFVLLAILILFTGCSATVNFDIGNTIKQDMTIKLDGGERSSKTVYETVFDSVMEVEKTTEMLSEYNFSNTESYSELSVDKESSIGDYQFDNALAMCYDTVLFNNANNMLSISTDDVASCFSNYPMLNELVINLTTDYKVLSNNADEINGNVYTWKINKNNYTNKKIKFSVDYSRDGNRDTSSKTNDTTPVIPDNSSDNKDDKVTSTSTFLPILIFVCTIFIIFLIFYIIYYFKNKKNNKI